MTRRKMRRRVRRRMRSSMRRRRRGRRMHSDPEPRREHASQMARTSLDYALTCIDVAEAVRCGPGLSALCQVI